MAEDEATGTEQGEAAPRPDASMRLDTRTLSSDDQAFARMMGFSEEPEAGAASASAAPNAPAAKPAVAKPSSAASPSPAVATSPAATPPTAAPSAPASSYAASAIATPPAPARDWEDIHPRAASLGRQSALVERADALLTLEPEPTPSAPPPGVADAVRPPPTRDVPAYTTNAWPRSESPEQEKQVEALQQELDTTIQERDRLLDELALAHSAQADAAARAERLDVALRAARGPGGPIPDGERELRAEVIGLRRRLDEAGAEQRRLHDALDASATDLAIARAHRDDRQHELDQQRARIEALEADRDAQQARFDEALVRQRELLALVARVQAENVELRSTQAALEETLEARDLEISAREEHLQVTRRGLTARDEQLLEAAQRLDAERQRHAALDAELEQARQRQGELEAKLARRDARIAQLATTLARIEDAIGRPASAAAERAHERPRSEGARPARPRPAPDATSRPASIATRDAIDAPHAPHAPTTPNPAAPADPAATPHFSKSLARWRDARLRATCGKTHGGSVAEFLALQLAARRATDADAPLRVTSLGGANLEAEIALARALSEAGLEAAAIRVLDADALRAERRRAAVAAAGLASSIAVDAWDGASPADGGPVDALLLSDALWDGAMGTTALAASAIERFAPSLADGGLLLFCDRIAGGAVRQSETTRGKLAELWSVLPETWTSRPGFATPPESGDDGGASATGTESLAALFDQFAPIATVGLGHVADLFVGPTRAAALDAAGDATSSLLESIDALDESRSITESLPARHGVGVFVRRGAGGEAEACTALGLPWPQRER